MLLLLLLLLRLVRRLSEIEGVELDVEGVLVRCTVIKGHFGLNVGEASL